MMNAQTNLAAYARTAGILYVALFILGPFVFLFGKATALVPGDPEASAANVVVLSTQFRVGLLIEAAISLIEIILAALLYVMFRPVNHALSLAAAFARLGEALVQGVNTMTSGVVLLIVGGGSTAFSAFSATQRDALVHLFLSANAFMVLIWGIFFGFHLVLLGYLVSVSEFLPRWLGRLLVLAGAGYLVQSGGMILWPHAEGILDVLVVVMAVPGELAFALWLLVRGVDVPIWHRRTRDGRVT